MKGLIQWVMGRHDLEWVKQVIHSSGVAGVRGVSMLIGYGNTILISWLYGVEGLGLYGLTFAVMQLFLVFANAGVPYYLSKSMGETDDPAERMRAVRSAKPIIRLFALVSFLILLFASYPLSYRFFNEPTLFYGLLIGCLILPARLFLLNYAEALNGLHKPVHSAILLLLVPSSSVLIVCVVSFLFGVRSPYLPLLAHAIGCMFSMVTARVLMQRTIGQAPKAARSQAPLKARALLSVSYPMALTKLSLLFLNESDRLMIGYFLDLEQVGFYSVLNRLALLCMFAAPGIVTVSSPKVSRYARLGDLDSLRELAHRTRNLSLIVCGVPFLVIVVFGKVLLRVFDPRFQEYSSLLLLLSISQVLIGTIGIANSFLNMSGHQKISGRNAMIAAGLNFILNMLLIPRWGILGAAISTVIGILFWTIGSNLQMRAIFGFNFLGRLREPPLKSSV